MRFDRPLIRVLIVSSAALLVTVGCTLPYNWQALLNDSAEPSPSPAEQPPYGACIWQWATELLPDLTADLILDLSDAGLTVAPDETRVTAFGENCLEQSGEVAYFAAMQTDFDVSLAVAALTDRDAVGDALRQVLATIVTGYSVDETPGPNPGRIIITVQDGTDSLTVMVAYQAAADLLAQDMSGAELFDALNAIQ